MPDFISETHIKKIRYLLIAFDIQSDYYINIQHTDYYHDTINKF